jgi:hypothetical protein
LNHLDVTLASTNARKEIKGSFDILVAEGIPSNKIGFRHPFLSLSKSSYDDTLASGADYESSITLNPLTQGYWPFTLDNGMPFSPQPCTIGCDEIAATSYSSIFPMYQMLDENNDLYSTMVSSTLPLPSTLLSLSPTSNIVSSCIAKLNFLLDCISIV